MGNPFTGTFDANQFAPRQGGGAHPVGKYPFTIDHTEIKQNSKGTGGLFVVVFKSDQGQHINNYNLWNESPKAVEIAHGQLSALCHATGIFKLDWANEGAALRGARGQMEIGYQKGEEPTAEKPGGGYVELKKVYDANGNEPGRAPAAAPQTMQRDPVQSDTAQPWGNGQAPQPQQQASNPAWPGPNGATQQNPNWQPGPTSQGAPNGAPPWAK